MQHGARLVDGDVGKLGGLLAAICFLVFPSALQWYGQNHKDAFAIVGLLLVLDAWLAIHDDRYFVEVRDTIRVFLAALLGAVLLGLVRPYFVVVVVLGLLASFLISSIWRSRAKVAAIRLAFVVVLALMAAVFVRYGVAEGVYGGNSEGINVGTYASTSEKFLWKETEGMSPEYSCKSTHGKRWYQGYQIFCRQGHQNQLHPDIFGRTGFAGCQSRRQLCIAVCRTAGRYFGRWPRVNQTNPPYF